MQPDKLSQKRDLLAWLGLRLIPGVGGVRYARLLEAFGSPRAVLEAPAGALARVPGVGRALAQDIRAKAWAKEPAEELEGLAKLGARVVTLADPEYPSLLAGVYAAPPVLYVRGSLEGCAKGGVAVVGARQASNYGLKVALELGRDLARAGVSLISGLALGIDAAAHTGALEAGGHSVGVLGCGLNVAYPRDNRGLMAALAKRGAVISEFPLDTPPAAGNFPVRNRIISGLSRAVVVVEGGLRSGSLITARHALDQGREVFAVPGPVGTPGVEGCHHLIRQGARLLDSARDLLEPGALSPAPEAADDGQEAFEPPELPAEAKELMKYLGHQPIHLDELVRGSGLPPQEVTALLVNLELDGRVSALPGKHYVLN